MRVNIGALKGKRGASNTVAFRVANLPGLDWGTDVTAVEPLDVQATVTNTGSCYLVRGTVQTTLELQCNRCLKSYRWQLAAPLEEEYFSESENRGNEQEHNRLFAENSTFAGDTIDLSEAVREQAVLEIPYKALCAEDCAGLCPICGQNLNVGKCGCEPVSIDPRLADLARLLENKSNNGDAKK